VIETSNTGYKVIITIADRVAEVTRNEEQCLALTLSSKLNSYL